MPLQSQNEETVQTLTELLGEEEKKKAKDITEAPQLGTLMQWFGHAFIYLTSDSGIRIAMNPYSDGIFEYTFPNALPADIVLISCESADYSGGKGLFGLPQVFRSLAGVGLNNANGITFRGTRTFRDGQRGRQLGGNTVYSFILDGIRYCHLGALGHKLDFKQRSKIGKVDVLFVSAGNRILSMAQVLEIADSLKAKYIIPIAYETDKSQGLNFRKFEDLDFGSRPIQKVADSQFVFTEDKLPDTATILLLQSP